MPWPLHGDTIVSLLLLLEGEGWLAASSRCEQAASTASVPLPHFPTAPLSLALTLARARQVCASLEDYKYAERHAVEALQIFTAQVPACPPPHTLL